MKYWFDEAANQPAHRQWYEKRLKPLQGLIVVHMTEGFSPLSTAHWCTDRTDAGSYHTIVGAESTIHMMPLEWAAFHAKDHNSTTTGFAFSGFSDRWRSMERGHRESLLRAGVVEAVRQIRWYAEQGIEVPVKMITRAEALAGGRGLIGHGDLDGPTSRRTDPGPRFPWVAFLSMVQAELAEPVAIPTTTTEGDEVLYQAMQETRALYMFHTKGNEAAAEQGVQDWLPTLHKAAYGESRGADLRATMEYIDWKLAGN